MESEKVKEIKEALKCLSGHKPCNLCSYHELAEMQETCCINVVAEEVIDYINELEECSKKWQKLCADEVALNTPLKERINELESEKKKLYNLNQNLISDKQVLMQENERVQEQNGALSCDLDYVNEKLTNAEIEIDDYKDRIAELEKENGELLKENEGYHGSYRCAIDKIGELSAERYIKVEQFAERLKEKFYYEGRICRYIIDSDVFDETLKEFINEE